MKVRSDVRQMAPDRPSEQAQAMQDLWNTLGPAACLDTGPLVHLLEVLTEVGHVVVAADDNGRGSIAADVPSQPSKTLLSRAANSDQQSMSTAHGQCTSVSALQLMNEVSSTEPCFWLLSCQMRFNCIVWP